ncbi:MAG TPA: gamma-glutamyltransferase, partial [Marmoricola sp.]|nr:gamma-glutamyltransferase [Marmoricola sp.]
MRLRVLAVAATVAVTLTGLVPAASSSVRPTDARPAPPKVPTAIGYGGAVSSVDPNATQVGLEVLRRGGNATDAAIATAVALGVSEPFSSGIGGGGFLVHYDARTGAVSTIDGRETAPAAMAPDAFIDPSTGQPYPFSPERVTSGVAVGVPGTLATWQRALDRWGSMRLDQVMRPGIRLAQKGFVVDDTFRGMILDNRERFEAFPATEQLFLPGGEAPQVGTVFRNPDLAATYRLIARHGTDFFYDGPLAAEIADNVQHPRISADTDLPVPPGSMTAQDIADYTAINREPTHVDYRGYDVFGMPPASSGGSTGGEALNIMEQFDVPAMDDVQALHHYLEASALAFADRGKYLGDTAYVDVPLDQLLSDRFAAGRACEIDPMHAATKPVAAGDVDDPDGDCTAAQGQVAPDTENINTTNLTVADRWGNVVEYTLTIEQTGGSGMVLPGRGFLLNNELTDFSAVPSPDDPNSVEGGKRPRSSISPTIVLSDGKPFVALGSPGGSTIITTVLQMIFNRIDRGMTIQEAIAAPRASQRNTADVTAEPAFVDAYGAALGALGHTFAVTSEIGAATAIEFRPDGSMVAVAEPTRRGGGSAGVL